MSTTQTQMPSALLSAFAGHMLDPAQSPTFRVMDEAAMPLQYGTGQVLVQHCADFIAIGDYSAYAQFGAAVDLPAVWHAMPYSGILGLGLPAQARLGKATWWQSATRAADSNVPPPPFTIFVPPIYASPSAPSGTLTLGGVDEAQMAAPPLWAPLRPMQGGYIAWTVELFSVHVIPAAGSRLASVPTQQLCPDHCTGDVDSGTSLVLMPEAAYHTFARQVQLASNESCMTDTAFMLCHAAASDAAVFEADLKARLPNVTFTVAARETASGGEHDAYDIVLTPAMYLCCGTLCGHADGECRVSVGVGGFGAGGFILGDTLMSHYVTVFHEEYKAVGFAPNQWGVPLQRSGYQLPRLPWYATPSLWVGGALSLLAVLLAWRIGKQQWGNAGDTHAPSSNAPQGSASQWGAVPLGEAV